MWQLVIIIFLPISMVKGQIEVHNVTQSGIMFESLGLAYTYQTKWTLVTRLTLLDPKETLDFIEHCEKMVTTDCASTRKDEAGSCAHWHSEITAIVKGIKQQIEEISLYLGSHKRKRGLVNVIGKFSKFLFGTMDDGDAATIYNRLNTLEQHDKSTLHLIQRQITVLKSTFDTTTSQLHNLSLHQTQLDSKFNELATKMRSEMVKMTQEVRTLHMQTEKNQILLFILTKLQFIHSYISDQFSLINSLHQHKLHPLIVSSSVLKKVVNEITDRTQKYLQINDFYLLNQVVEVSFYHDEKGVIIKLKIPLIFAEPYSLHKIHLIPIHINSHTSILDITTNYILSNTEKHHMELTQQEFKENCNRYNSDEHHFISICRQNQPKIIDHNKPNCVANLLFDKTLDENYCRHKIVAEVTDIFVKLDRQDTWLFVLEKPHKILSHCEEVTSVRELVGSGILTLTKPCTFTLDGFEIPFEGNPEIQLPIKQPRHELYPKFKISSRKPLPFSKATFPEITIKPYQSDLSRLIAQGKTVKELDQEVAQEERERKAQQHQTQSHVNSASITCIAIVIIVITILKLFKKFKNKIPFSPQESQAPVNIVLQDLRATNESTIPRVCQKTEQAIETPLTASEPLQRLTKLQKSFRLRF